MSNKINLAEIQLRQLNGMSLMQISKFAHALETKTGVVLSLQNEDILRQVVYQAKRSKSAELQRIYLDLKLTIKAHLNSGKFSNEEISVMSVNETTQIRVNSS